MKYFLWVFLLFFTFSAKSLKFSDSIIKQKHVYYKQIAKKVHDEFRIREIKNLNFSLELLYEYIELKYPYNSKVPICQFVLETGWFTSDSFVKYNNLSGMKFPEIRYSVAISEKLGHSSYSHWTDSVDDYYLWLVYRIKKGCDTSDYYLFLKTIGYAEDPLYISKLKSIEEKLCLTI